MFPNLFQVDENVEKHHKTRLLDIFPPNLSSHGLRHNKSVSVSLLSYEWLGFSLVVCWKTKNDKRLNPKLLRGFI